MANRPEVTQISVTLPVNIIRRLQQQQDATEPRLTMDELINTAIRGWLFRRESKDKAKATKNTAQQ